MRIPPFQIPKPRRASALAIILAVITLLTVLVLTFLGVARYERTSSNLSLGRMQAETLADFAADTAMIKLREAIAAGTYIAGGSNSKTWASMPGRIAVFDLTISRPNNVTYYDIFSGTAGPDTSTPDLNNVDLNKPSILQDYPIATPTAASPGTTMKVGWINMLADDGTTASSANPIVGRIAYWMDDETCKVNINTADGSRKTDLNPDGSVADGSVTGYPAIANTGTVGSYGFGTPSEISLAALPTASGTLSGTSIAAVIAAYASGTASGPNAVNNTAASITGFNSAAEVGRAISGSNALNYYKTNKFNITHTCQSPDLNMFGEPRINLFPILGVIGNTLSSSGTIRTEILGVTGAPGAYAQPTDFGSQDNIPYLMTAPINFVYPLSEQLPKMVLSGSTPALPQYPSIYLQASNNWNDIQGGASAVIPNYNLGMRIADYLIGKNSLGQAITWPNYSSQGATVTGYYTNSTQYKYNLRQIDSITLQILDMISQADLCDEGRGYNLPTLMSKGFLSGTFVTGFARAPKLTAVYFDFAAGTTNNFTGYTVPFVQINAGNFQVYFPRYFTGMPFSTPYFVDSLLLCSNGANVVPTINFPDMPGLSGGSSTPPLNQVNGTPGEFGGFWCNHLMYFGDAGGNNLGVDLTGNPWKAADPDQANAAIYHPYCLSSGSYLGSFGAPGGTQATVGPMLRFTNPNTTTICWYPGAYENVPSIANLSANYYGKPGTLISTLLGGVNFWTRGATFATYNESEFNPMESLLVPPYGSGSIATTAMTIPVSGTFAGGRATALTVEAWVSDPLVNKFPGDWQVLNTSAAVGTGINKYISGITATVKAFGTNLSGTTAFPPGALTMPDTTTSGDTPGYLPANGGDPLSVWAPPQDQRMPKVARFPSAGALNSIRTGIIPDTWSPGVASTGSSAGTPWRSICLASGSDSGQSTADGSYPDWVMLDLFTVPFVQQPPAIAPFPSNGSMVIPQPPARLLTFGGATEGRLNINNPLVPYPFSSGTWAAPQRTAPLQALFYGLEACTSYSSGTAAWTSTTPQSPVDSGTGATSLPTAVENYLTANGPFMIPGELSNVPAINNYTYQASYTSNGSSHNVRCRNDIMRQVFGATTTQSNTYSIWVVSQTIKKNPANTSYGVYQPGDTVTGEVRRRYLLQRYIEPGTDGVPGNAATSGTNAGTEADTITGDMTTSPPVAGPNPKLTYPLPYRWRIMAVEDVAR